MSRLRYGTKQEAIRALVADASLPEVTTREQAEQYLQAHIPPEKIWQARIREKIKEMFPSSFIWKAAQGSYSQGGLPDLCAVIGGRFFGFEIKRPYFGRATKLQLKTIKDIQAAGGQAYVVCWPEDVEELLRPVWEEAKQNEAT